MECLHCLMERKTPPVRVAEGHDHLGHKHKWDATTKCSLHKDKNRKAVPYASSVWLGCIFVGDLGVLHFSRKHNRSMQDTRSEQLVSHIFQRHLEAKWEGGAKSCSLHGYALLDACQDFA